MSANKISTSASKISTSANTKSTSANKISTSANKIFTSANKKSTSANKISTSANKASKSANKNYVSFPVYVFLLRTACHRDEERRGVEKLRPDPGVDSKIIVFTCNVCWRAPPASAGWGLNIEFEHGFGGKSRWRVRLQTGVLNICLPKNRVGVWAAPYRTHFDS